MVNFPAGYHHMKKRIKSDTIFKNLIGTPFNHTGISGKVSRRGDLHVVNLTKAICYQIG